MLTTVLSILFIVNVIAASAKGALDQLAVKYKQLEGPAKYVGIAAGLLSKLVGLVSANTTTVAAVASAGSQGAQAQLAEKSAPQA